MNFGGHFDPEVKEEKIKELENKMNEPNFWNSKDSANEIIK